MKICKVVTMTAGEEVKSNIIKVEISFTDKGQGGDTSCDDFEASPGL